MLHSLVLNNIRHLTTSEITLVAMFSHFIVHDLFVFICLKLLLGLKRAQVAMEKAIFEAWVVQLGVHCQNYFVACHEITFLALQQIVTLVLLQFD